MENISQGGYNPGNTYGPYAYPGVAYQAVDTRYVSANAPYYNNASVPQMPAYGQVQFVPYGNTVATNLNGNFYQPNQMPTAPVVLQPPTGPMPNHPPYQPTGEWMNISPAAANCLPGLECLLNVDQLFIKEKVDLLEAIVGFEANNKFSIKNSNGEKLYYAIEDNDCCTRNCLGAARPFDMKIFDRFQNQVIHMHRPLACSSCLFPCCLQSIEISSPPGSVIGTIEQEWSIFTPIFRIKNHVGDVVLRIQGPLCTYSICGSVEFNILSLTGVVIGKISKQWSGMIREIFTDADFFGITFPMDLDVRMKSVLMGAAFLINAMFYENTGIRSNDGPGML